MTVQTTPPSQDTPLPDLQEEINMLREVNRLARAFLDDCSSIQDRVRVIAALGMNLVRVATLVKTEYQLNSGETEDQMGAALEQALRELANGE